MLIIRLPEYSSVLLIRGTIDDLNSLGRSPGIHHMELYKNTSILAIHETIDLWLRKNSPLKPVTWCQNRAIINVMLCNGPGAVDTYTCNVGNDAEARINFYH